MKTVQFQSLRITNFKGCENLLVLFHQNTIIEGANKTGKTTIIDAINWLFFGKNSQNEKSFSIKNTVNTALNRADHSVEMCFMVDEFEVKAKRVYREKWTRKRGSETLTYESNESEMFWNEVPCTLGEFYRKVDEITPESLWKILTIPLFFNVQLKETERRDVIVRMGGDITDAMAMGDNIAYRELFARLSDLKSLEEYKREVTAQKATLKKILESYSYRIDEVLHNNPDTLDWATIEAEIKEKEKAVKQLNSEIDGIIDQTTKANTSIQSHYDANFSAKKLMAEIENDLRTKNMQDVNEYNITISRATAQLRPTENELSRLQFLMTNYKDSLTSIDKSITQLREDWENENKREFVYNKDSLTCSKCGQPLANSNIADAEETQLILFKKEKAEKLESINSNGKGLAKRKLSTEIQILDAEHEIDKLTEQQKLLTTESQKPRQELAETLVLTQGNNQYQSLKATVEKPLPELKVADVTDQREMRDVLLEGVTELKRQLATRDQIERNSKRVNELKKEESLHAKDLSELEKTEFTIESFQKTKMLMVEQAVNDKFTIVKFKLYETLVTGG